MVFTIASNRAINEHCAFDGVALSQCDVKYHPLELIMSKSVHLPSVRALIAATVLVAFSGLLLAVDLKVKLTGAEGRPPVTTSASGTAPITIAADKSDSATIKPAAMDGTVAHIHVGAPGQS